MFNKPRSVWSGEKVLKQNTEYLVSKYFSISKNIRMFHERLRFSAEVIFSKFFDVNHILLLSEFIDENILF
jgi:hypothetical protein